MTSVTQAWQDALAAEYAAVFGYGVLGPRLTSSDATALARANQQAHQDLSERTAAELIAAGQPAEAPEADYPLPFPVSDEPSAQRYAIRLETTAASAWRYLISVAADPSADSAGLDPNRVEALRVAAQTALTASALRAMRWRQRSTPAKATVPFPGIDE